MREDHEPAAEGAAATRDDLPTRAFERCSIRELDAPGGSAESIHVALVAAREPPPGDRDEGWLVLGWRDLGAPDWRWVMRPLPEPQPWVAKGSSRELVVAQGVLVGRALILDAAPDADTIGVRVLSYSDSGPPFQYPWRGLRAEVLSWGEGPERVGDGWLFIRARGELDFEHQGRRDGFFCALVKTRLEPTPSGGDSAPSVDEASQ